MHLPHLRLLPCLEHLPADVLSRWMREAGADDRRALAASLASPESVLSRVAALGEEDQHALRDLLCGLEIDDASAQALLEARLAWPWDASSEQPAPMGVPVEIRAALVGWDPWCASLAACLVQQEDTVQQELAALHRIPLEGPAGPLDRAVTLAAGLLAEERLSGWLESLQASARNLLYWLLEQGEPLPAGQVRAQAAEMGRRYQDAGQATPAMLMRIGWLHLHEDPDPSGLLVDDPDGEGWMFVPSDVRTALAPLLDAQLADRVFEAWSALRSSGLAAFSDRMPRGMGGDPLVQARWALMRHLRGERVASSTRQALESVGVLTGAPGAMGAHSGVLLDSGGPEAFARRALWCWMHTPDEPFTRALLDSVGARGDRLLAALSEALQEDPDESPETDPAWVNRWEELLQILKGHLLLALSVLPPGYWHRLDRLVAWFCALYRRTVWQFGRYWMREPRLDPAVLPMESVDVGPGMVEPVTSMLRGLIAGLLEPLGAVCLSEDGSSLLTNPEALRVLSDGELAGIPPLDHADSYLGEDMDLWLPAPVDPGIRIRGLATMRWLDARTLHVEHAVHMQDLLRLCGWFSPLPVAEGWEFHWDPCSGVLSGEEGPPPASLAQWLTARTESVPAAFRPLLPERAWRSRAWEELVEDVLLRWEQGTLQVTDALAVELRSWGPLARPALLAPLEARVESRRFSDPFLRLLCLLMGEWNATEATPALLRTLARARDPDTESCAIVALARLGAPGMEGLVGLLQNEAAAMEQRFHAVTALSSIAVLHPSLHGRATDALLQVLEDPELDPDFATMLAISVAESGHPEGEAVLHRTRERMLWLDEMVPFEEAVWIAGHSPCTWGPAHWAHPLASVWGPQGDAWDDLPEDGGGSGAGSAEAGSTEGAETVGAETEGVEAEGPPSDQDGTPRRRRGRGRG
jgi:hypothetical protein